jgi:hypothetical protein
MQRHACGGGKDKRPGASSLPMGEPSLGNVVRVLRATREVSHAASHLAHVAAEIARAGEDARAAEAATDSALAIARTAFRLDDALRAPVPGSQEVALALDVLTQTEEALHLARRALEQARLAA